MDDGRQVTEVMAKAHIAFGKVS